MKRFFKNWAGRKSPSPRKSRPSRRRHTSKRADVRHHEHEHEHDEAELQGLVPLTFLGYQYLPDGSFQPVYSAIQAAAYDAAQTTTAERHQNQTEASNDNLVGSQHFCYKCGKARSKRYHMDNPIIPGSKAPASCCTRCRKKNTTSDPGSKYLQHFCVECGRVRSRGYHDDNPVRAGQTPRPSYCLKCRTKRKQSVDQGDWEDIDAGETILALPRLKMPPSDYRVATEHGLVVPSASNEDFESDDSAKPKRKRQTSKDSTKLSIPAASRRNASRESVRSSRSFQASVEDAPPTPPRTPLPIVQKKQFDEKPNAEKRQSAEHKVAPVVPEKEPGVLSTTQTATSVAHVVTPGETALVVPQASQDCQKHVHVVYVHAPCHHHGCNDHSHSSHNASRSRTRGRRADSITTTTTSSKQSKRVAFATPEVSSRHEADSDYDRTAVPENHEEPFEFGVYAGGSPRNYNVPDLSPDRHPRRPPTPGPVPRGFDSSSGPSSSGYDSSYNEVDQPRLDGYSPPPEYTSPPKVFTPEEIKALWEQGEQPVHPRKQRQEAESRSNDRAPGRDYSSQNQESYATNQRSVSEGHYPLSSGTSSRPSASSYGSGHPGNSGPSDYRSSDYRSASDGRYRNDENIDPKTRYSGYTSSYPSQSENRGGSSQQNSNMYNTNQNNEYNSTRSSQSRGPRSSENNNPNMYNNSSNRTDGNSTSRPSQSRTSSRQSENNPPNLYNSNQGNNYPRSRPSEEPQSERPPTRNQENNPPKRESKRDSKRDTSRQTSNSTSTSIRDAPFTARERMWTDGPEEALKLREAMERLERAAASATLKTPKCPPTPEIQVNDTPMPEVTPDVSTPDFGSTMPDLGSDRRDFTSDTRGFSSGTFNSTKPSFGSDRRDFTSTTRDFDSGQFASDKPDFGSSSTRNFNSSTTRNFTSTTFDSSKQSFDKRDFSPNMPEDFVPPRPSGFAGPPPPVFNTPKATWEHPCGPYCNDFCPDRADQIDRDIREVDSDEEREILGTKASRRKKGGKKPGTSTLRKPSSDRASRLALVLLRRHSPAEGGPSPTQSVGSAYYTASEAEGSCY